MLANVVVLTVFGLIALAIVTPPIRRGLHNLAESIAAAGGSSTTDPSAIRRLLVRASLVRLLALVLATVAAAFVLQDVRAAAVGTLGWLVAALLVAVWHARHHHGPEAVRVETPWLTIALGLITSAVLVAGGLHLQSELPDRHPVLADLGGALTPYAWFGTLPGAIAAVSILAFVTLRRMTTRQSALGSALAARNALVLFRITCIGLLVAVVTVVAEYGSAMARVLLNSFGSYAQMPADVAEFSSGFDQVGFVLAIPALVVAIVVLSVGNGSTVRESTRWSELSKTIDAGTIPHLEGEMRGSTKVITVLVALLGLTVDITQQEFGVTFLATAVPFALRDTKLYEVDRFRERGGLEPTREVVAAIARQLYRGRVLRRMPFIVLLIAFGLFFDGFAPALLVAGSGYLVGLLIDGIVSSRELPSSGIRHAALGTRTVKSYADTRLRLAPIGVFIISFFTFWIPFAYVKYGVDDIGIATLMEPFWIYTAVVAAIAVLGETTVRLVAQRAQRTSNPEMILIDDARRSSTTYTAVRTTLALCLVAFAAGAISLSQVIADVDYYSSLDYSAGQALRRMWEGPLGVVGAIGVLGAFIVFFKMFESDYWRVSRLVRR